VEIGVDQRSIPGNKLLPSVPIEPLWLNVVDRNTNRPGPQSSQFLAHINCNQRVHRDHIICNWDRIVCNGTAIKNIDPHPLQLSQGPLHYMLTTNKKETKR
jgi:hypothetical protein